MNCLDVSHPCHVDTHTVLADFWTSEASPLIEAIDRPQARIYQLGEDDLSVVMIVDESLDV